MTPRDFCYWLQGFFELNDVSNLSEEQTKMIEEHLQLVFTKETKSPSQYLPETENAGCDWDLKDYPICDPPIPSSE